MDVVDLGCGLSAPYNAALAVIALENTLSDALPSGVIPMGTWHLATPYHSRRCSSVRLTAPGHGSLADLRSSVRVRWQLAQTTSHLSISLSMISHGLHSLTRLLTSSTFTDPIG